MKSTFPTEEHQQLMLFIVFSKIPLKIEGGLIAPLQLAVGESEDKNASVLFKNVKFEFDQQEVIGINIDEKTFSKLFDGYNFPYLVDLTIEFLDMKI